MPQSLPESTMTRLFNSAVQSQQSRNGIFPTISSIQSAAVLSDGKSTESLTGSCRICRYHRSDMQVCQCPCNCKGSVGFVHMHCLKQWILHRRDNRCEICHQPYNLPVEKFDIIRMMKSFFSFRCFGSILKNFTCAISLLPLANVIFQQVLMCMERINQNPRETISLGEVLVASFAMLTSSALFFHFFDYITYRFLVIKRIFSQWWMFGASEDFANLELGSQSFDML